MHACPMQYVRVDWVVDDSFAQIQQDLAAKFHRQFRVREMLHSPTTSMGIIKKGMRSKSGLPSVDIRCQEVRAGP